MRANLERAVLLWYDVRLAIVAAVHDKRTTPNASFRDFDRTHFLESAAALLLSSSRQWRGGGGGRSAASTGLRCPLCLALARLRSASALVAGLTSAAAAGRCVSRLEFFPTEKAYTSPIRN